MVKKSLLFHVIKGDFSGLSCLILWFLLGGQQWVRATTSHGGSNFQQFFFFFGFLLMKWYLGTTTTPFTFSLLASFWFLIYPVFVFMGGVVANAAHLVFWQQLWIIHLGLHDCMCSIFFFFLILSVCLLALQQFLKIWPFTDWLNVQ